jgi:hypothetical protein
MRFAATRCSRQTMWRCRSRSCYPSTKTVARRYARRQPMPHSRSRCKGTTQAANRPTEKLRLRPLDFCEINLLYAEVWWSCACHRSTSKKSSFGFSVSQQSAKFAETHRKTPNESVQNATLTRGWRARDRKRASLSFIPHERITTP